MVVLAIDAYRARPDLPSALLALTLAIAAFILVPDLMLVSAFAAFAGVLLARSALERWSAARA